MQRYIFFTSSPNEVNQGVPLVLAGPPVKKNSGLVNLSITGSHSGATFDFGSIPLFLNGIPMLSSLSLFLQGQAGVNELESDTVFNLFLKSEAIGINNLCNLYLNGGIGSGKPVNNYFNLFIEGQGIFENYTPFSSNMILFLSSTPYLTGNVNLFLQARDSNQQSVNNYLFGVQGIINSSSNLYLDAVNSINNNVSMFLRGFTT